MIDKKRVIVLDRFNWRVSIRKKTMNDEDAVKYWVNKLNDAIQILRQIAVYQVNTQLEASAMKQLAINFLISNGYMPPSEVIQ